MQGATFDPTHTYRYSLWRQWDEQRPSVGFVMLNPSRADALVDDPTIRRCLGFAKAWNYGGLEVVNLFAYRTASPVELRRVSDPVGAENDRYLISLAQRVDRIILAWGNWGTFQQRDRAVIQLLGTSRLLDCLGLTQMGHPRHPLYLRRGEQPQPYEDVGCRL